MSNMSYCRFRNTLRDLVDCQDALEALFDGCESDGAPVTPLSTDEQRAAIELIYRCSSILQLCADQVGVDVDALDLLDRQTKSLVEDANELAEKHPAHDRVRA